jgi:Spy/CpxP family protein refolding chaperone
MTDPIERRAGLVRRAALGAAVAVSFVAGAATVSAFPAAAETAAAYMSHGGHGGMHARAAAHLDRMLTEVDATPDQKARIHAIMQGAFESLKPMHGGLEQTQRDLHALLTAPTIDRAALERLRVARMADADQAGKVLVKALADSAEVLRPDQRAKLGELAAGHHARRD